MAQYGKLLASLPASTALLQRLLICDVIRDGAGADIGRSPKRCTRPACPSCRSMYATREGKEIGRLSDGVQLNNGGMLTVVIGAYGSLDEAGSAFEKWKVAARTLVRAMRANSARWNTFHLDGWLEMDAVCPSQAGLLGGRRLRLLEGFGFQVSAATEPVWVVTVHAVVFGARLDWQEIRRAFAERWPLTRQVHLSPFRAANSVQVNIRNIVCYALKYRHVTKLSGAWVPWPESWQVEFHVWLQGWSKAFLKTRVTIKPPIGHRARVIGRRAKILNDSQSRFGRNEDRFSRIAAHI